MNTKPMSFTLRELRTEFSRPFLWLVLLGAAAILALAGAFGTGAVLAFVPRLAYWIVLVVTTYGAGVLCNLWVGRRLAGASMPLRVAVQGGATSVLVAGIIVAMNTALFGRFLQGWLDWVAFLGPIFVVTLIISAVLDVAFRQLGPVAGGAPDQPSDPPLLAKLPFDKRGALMALTSEDHYTRVRTTQGHDLVLIRLSDAIALTPPCPGVQVHRSHWIADTAVARVTRRGDGARITLTDGTEIPVSRTRIPAIREKGWL